MICCTTASVRARLVPGGIVSETATSFWSCAGTKPRGVSITRQAVSTTKPAYSATSIARWRNAAPVKLA